MRLRLLLFSLCCCFVLPSITLSAQEEMLSNPGFEGTYSTIATSWSNGPWGGAVISYERNSTEARNGYCQKMTLTTAGTGGSFIYQNVTILPNHIYEARVWLKAESEADVSLFTRVQNGDSPYYYHNSGAQYIKTKTTWTEVRFKIVPYFDSTVTHRICIRPLTVGVSIYLDDASLVDITDQELGFIDCSTEPPVKNDFFSLHINKGHEGHWPEIDQGMIRLWDTGTRWKDIEPIDDGWNWTRFDLYMNLIRNNNPDCKIMYTLGMTPSWARSDGDSRKGPDDLSDWDDYVTEVATRYKGRIHYYEIWNEVDYATTFWAGGMESMCELASRAYSIIKAIDPQALVLTPNFTCSGLSHLSQYLAIGGKNYADALSFHIYYSYDAPRTYLAKLLCVKDIADYDEIGHLPIFLTEGAAKYETGVSVSDSQARSAVARGYFISNIFGAKTFGYYFWEPVTGRIPLSESDHETLTAGGIAYKNAVAWIVGANVQNASFSYNGTMVKIEIERGTGYKGYILWNPDGNISFTPPSDWHIANCKYLDGTSSAYTSGSFTIGIEPVLLEADQLYLNNKLAHFKFEDNSSTALDCSNFANNATTLGTGTVTGKYGNAIKFGGWSGSKATIPYDQSLCQQNLTVAFWINHEMAQTGFEKFIIFNGSNSGYYIFVDSNDNLRFRLFNGSGGSVQTSASLGSYGQWDHVAATYDGQTLLLYINGVPQPGTTASSYNIGYNTNDFTVGKYFKGMLDDMRIYNYALTEDEVKALCSKVSHWKMDNGVAVDSVSDNDGVLSSGVESDAGIFDGALFFPRSGGDVTIQDALELRPTEMSVSLWLNSEEVFKGSSQQYKTIVSKSSWDDRLGFSLLGDNKGYIYFRLYDTTNWGWLTQGQIDIPYYYASEWTHIVATFDGVDTIRLFINGTLAKEKITTSTFDFHTHSGNLKIGNSSGIGIDDLRFYNKALSIKQVKDMYYNEN